ncbi:hypothetical protein ACFQNF_16165 [Iodobacter arcticus]|uniref:Glycine zipper family protein n=1 Tax=Iodobacter arcticus TaxID=590593 RepID=A0ABW2R0T3_9NEIS
MTSSYPASAQNTQSEVEYRGPYPLYQSHELSSPLKQSIESFEAAAARFATDAIKDEHLRQQYKANISRISNQVKTDVAAGKISVKEGMDFCQQMRNKIMDEVRSYTSAQGLAVAEKKKAVGMTQEILLNKYSNSIFNKNYTQLNPSQKDKVYYAIIESSTRDSAKFTAGTKAMKIMGKVGIIATAIFAIGSIIIADNKVKETAKQGGILAGGAAGGLLAGLTVSMICGPGAPFCAVAIVLAGSIAGGLAGEAAVDSFDNELEEFSKWNIH